MIYPEWKHNENDLESHYYELDDEHVSSQSSSYTVMTRYMKTEMKTKTLRTPCSRKDFRSVQTFITLVKTPISSGEDCEEVTCHCSTTCSQGATFCPVKQEISTQQAKQVLI